MNRPVSQMDSSQERLERSISGLRAAAPEMSAHAVLTRGQGVALGILVLLVVGAGVLDTELTMRIAVGLATAFYTATLVYRLVLVRRGMEGTDMVRISDDDARAIADADLPIYTVLVPAYREPDVIGKVIDAVAALEYPADKLDVRLMLEADDQETIAAARERIGPSDPIEIVLVPVAEPRTKPKACNYGLQTARGELVTIFDAEDRPEPLQLRRAVAALRELGDGYACVQARLGYFNATQNLITRWFSIEYANWFRLLLPGLASVGAPIPLGGTSNHFRAGLLRSLGSWDAYNVTEDADLGIRLARLGYRVGVLDSITQEEANSDFVNWIKQRSRWYKGYLQTWLVHMRHPIRIHRELGVRGSFGLHLFVFGTPMIALLNPIFWALTIVWYRDKPEWVASLFPPAVFYFALASFLVGNASVIYMSLVTTRYMRMRGLLMASLTVPAYWVMMSIAATKAAYQLIVSPSYWEKTSHGLTTSPAAETTTAQVSS